MIKGVSKQIIEIKCTNNEYFEKALLFVNSKNNIYSHKQLDEQAKLFAYQLGGDTTLTPQEEKNARIVCYTVLALLIAGITAGVVVLMSVI